MLDSFGKEEQGDEAILLSFLERRGEAGGYDCDGRRRRPRWDPGEERSIEMGREETREGDELEGSRGVYRRGDKLGGAGGGGRGACMLDTELPASSGERRKTALPLVGWARRQVSQVISFFFFSFSAFICFLTFVFELKIKSNIL